MRTSNLRSSMPAFSLLLMSCCAQLTCLAAEAPAATVPDGIHKQIQDGYCRRALDQLQPLMAAHAKEAEYQFQYGQALLGVNRLDDALTAMKAAVALAPDDGIYHRGLGDVYGAQTFQASMFSMYGLAKSTLSEYQAAVRLAPGDVASHVDLAMYYIMAPGIAGGSLDKAHIEESALDKLDPVQALQVRAAEATQGKDAKAAEALYKQAVAADKTTGSLVALGLFYTDAKRYPEAMQVFRDATTQDAQSWLAWYQIGRVAGFARTDYAEGQAALQRYLAADLPDNVPTLAWAHFRLGNLYETQGQATQARAEYRAADQLKAGDKLLAGELGKKDLGGVK
jgi:tetratricopeptide (TPR) repeat protein